MEELGHTVNICWNIKQSRTKKPLSMFIVELKADPNNKAIYIKIILLSKFRNSSS